MKHYRTRKDSDERLSQVPLILDSEEEMMMITVDPSDQGQEIIGFGGSFTESSAYNLLRINKYLREKAIQAYFDPIEGLGYTIGRVPIHGCDFSLGSYLYIKDHDDTLESFSIERDEPKIELIHDAERIAGQKIRIVASPWTPPFWMKDNNSPIKGGKLLKKYYQTWADYFIRFIEAYEKKGVTISWVSVQNEPNAAQRWDSCVYTAEEERDFVKILGSTFEKAGYKDKGILIWDHDRNKMVERASAIYKDPVAYRYVWGTAFHWYGEENFENVMKLHKMYPKKHLLFTEGCQIGRPHFGRYETGELYGRNIINDLRNRTEGYIDWNLFLDETGGPNHVNYLCSAPIIISVFKEEIIKMPSYFYIGHFSKFIRPGAVQIGSNGPSDLLFLSFQNKDGSQIIVIQNEKEKDFNVEVSGLREKVRLTIMKRSISTIVIQ